ncbi:septum formation initiator family protein [bacterium]|nr:septum formation initiator family protein [bacterium]
MKKIGIKILIGVVSFFLIILGIQTFRKIKEINVLEKKEGLLKRNLEKMKAENLKLEEEIKYFQNPQNLEKEARKRFSLKKEGEKVIIITK